MATLVLWGAVIGVLGEESDTLYTRGTLLFKEDFGGNDESDSIVSTEPVPGMSYRLITGLETGAAGGSMSSGRYLVTKRGYRNSSDRNYSQWHIMDDHTFDEGFTVLDTTVFPDRIPQKGYFMEIDGDANTRKAFYKTTLRGLCAGTKLSFSAYIANVVGYWQIQGWEMCGFPRLRFEIKDPLTNNNIATYDTGDIQPDWSFKGEDGKMVVSNAWKWSAHWQHVGMTFDVPEGIDSVELAIYNNYDSGCAGNDFALDDIEVRLCTPPVSIVSPHMVCEGRHYAFKVHFDNADNVMPEPLEYQWFFTQEYDASLSEDEQAWIPVTGGDVMNMDLGQVVQADSGWYRLMIAGEGNLESPNCRAVSAPFHLIVNPDCPICTEGRLLFREDFGGNEVSDPRVSQTPLEGISTAYSQIFDDYWTIPTLMQPGKFIVTKSGYCNGDTTSSYSQWHIQCDHTHPGDYTRGYFLEVDGKGDHEIFYTKTLDGLCEGMELSFVAYVANVELWKQTDDNSGQYASPRLTFTLTHPETGAVLKSYTTCDIEPDGRYTGENDWRFSSEWREFGMNFAVPEGLTSVILTISNDVDYVLKGNDFAIDDISVFLCAPEVEIVSDDAVCREEPYTFVPVIRNGTDERLAFAEPLDWQWYFSSDQTDWQAIEGSNTASYQIARTWDDNAGWYKVAVAEQGNVMSEHCRAESDPFLLNIKKCPLPDAEPVDTLICDTLILYTPYRWRYFDWRETGSRDTLLHYTTGEDSIRLTFVLDTMRCCPDIRYEPLHRSLCDTLMPYTWVLNRQSFVFEDITNTYDVPVPHRRWTKCTDSVYTLTIDTFHCERLFPIIVNKYNWQLLLDHVTLRKLFPERAAVAYQWYKNEEAIEGATEDDYSEQKELDGRFQLRVQLDDRQTIWSNVLDIESAQSQLPINVRIYNYQGSPVREDQVTRGIYLFHYEQGEKQWTEKKWIP